MLHTRPRYASARQSRVAMLVPAIIALCLSGSMTSSSVYADEPAHGRI